MKLLLDTHAFIWAISRSRLLSARAAELIKDPENRVLVSAASAYEIEFKRARDPALAALPADLGEAVDEQGFEWLAVSPAHAVTAGRLPRLSGDPFDRILAAQALAENATILTRDPLVVAYGPVSAW
jgi:PIN domain nuclease of toxin-antitoxin system